MGVGLRGRLSEQGRVRLLAEAFDRSLIAKAVAGLADGAFGVFAEVNAAFAALLGRRPAELVGRPCTVVFDPADHGALLAVLDRLAGGELPEITLEWRLAHRDGSRVWVTAHAMVSHDDAGVPYLFLEAVEHPADRAGEEQTSSAFDSSALGMLITDLRGRVLRANPAVARMLGRTAAELVGRPDRDFVHPDDLPDTGERQRSAAGEDAGAVTYEQRLLRGDGGVVWARLSVADFLGADGERLRLVQVDDITARRAAQDAAGRAMRRLEVTIGVQREITAAASDRDAVLRLIAERTLQVLPAGDTAVVQLADRDDEDTGGAGVLRTVAGIGPLAARSVPPLPIAAPGTRPGSLSALVVATDATLRSDDTATDPRTSRATSQRTGIRSLVAAPLRGPGGAPLGVLVVASRHPGAFDAGDEQQLTLLADALSGALRHADDAARQRQLLAVAEQANADLAEQRAAALTAVHAAATAAEREHRRLQKTLQAQRDVIAAAGDLDTTLQVVADRATGLFPSAGGALVELVDGARHPQHTAGAGILAGAVGRPAPAGALGAAVLSTGRAAHSPDTAGDPHVDRAACGRLGVAALLVAPLHADDRTIGALTVAAGRPGAFDAADEQQLALFADSVSAALQHADDTARAAELLQARTEALAALRASEERFATVFAGSPVGLLLSSVDGGDVGAYLAANPAMTTITGYPAAELVGRHPRLLEHPDHGEAGDVTVTRILAGGPQGIRLDRRWRHRDGHDIWVSMRLAAVRADDGQARYVVTQVEDVTARRAAFNRLQQQAALLDLAPAAIIVRDLDGRIRWWNQGATDLYGWPPGVAQGRITHRLFHTAFPAGGGLAAQAAALREHGRWEGPLEHVTAGGRTVTVLSRQVRYDDDLPTGVPAGDGAGPAGAAPAGIVLEVNTDVTAARAAERALADSEARFKAQFDNSAIGQVVRALDGTILVVNPAYATMLGSTPQRLTGTAGDALVHPDDRPAVLRHAAALFAGDVDAYTHEIRLRHADGHHVDVEATVTLVRTPDGRPDHLIGVAADVTARRAAERARDAATGQLAARNRELEDANRLKLDLIGMLGHEIGNPLAAILGYTEVFADDWANLDDARRARVIEGIDRQARRLDDIVQEVLTMVRIDAGSIHADRGPVALRPQLRAALDAAGGERIPVLGPERTALVNAGHLDHILTNLISNAGKYGNGVTAVTVADGGDDGTGPRVQVRVEDRGPGVPEEFRERLFQRLARADRDAAKVKGTGLGLYIVRSLAQANGARVHHEPNPAGGSIFVVDLEAG
ncbi:PAS domain S-box protein [Dactylosporangium aurantiacum]|uniref:histidine kinase n=1 Tax=Dactylosporangium aurantiacum TaxID=35754 RepID=A0A9Q9IR42_9ACTN|nr:PAS domain S-box protein [Dactylosporangium aurantiacum]MDG6107737.1 PAS domain S-box protein [Dactylosporangium aurantiacum]UWZ57478.1 PAS domain S-box protein [Dactylosporangium aurantiacum]